MTNDYDQMKTKSEIIDKLMIRDGFIFLIIQTHLKSLPISPPELLLATNLPSVLPGILFISFVLSQHPLQQASLLQTNSIV